MTPASAPARVRVWDVPVRLFHWLLLALIGFSWWSGEQGNEWMEYHGWSGYAILTLVLFRIAWGFVGSDTARFAHFVRGPRISYAYFRSVLQRRPEVYLGHNPLGGWMILSLMLVLLVQAMTGLFGNDDDAYEAPLSHWLSHDTSSLITTLHAYNFDLLLGLIGLHVAAVFDPSAAAPRRHDQGDVHRCENEHYGRNCRAHGVDRAGTRAAGIHGCTRLCVALDGRRRIGFINRNVPHHFMGQLLKLNP